MSLFHNICVDNFFKDPSKIVEISKSLDYSDDHKGYGLRSTDLSKININLFNYINWKIINTIYPGCGHVDYYATTTFQKSNIDKCDGWVHRDEGFLTAIIYLNPKGTFGTSIYEKINEYDSTPQFEKSHYFKNITNYTDEQKEEVYRSKINNNNKFYKTIDYSGKFNRLICFGAGVPHAANVDCNLENHERLIIISFIEYIKINKFSNVGYLNLDF